MNREGNFFTYGGTPYTMGVPLPRWGTPYSIECIPLPYYEYPIPNKGKEPPSPLGKNR